MSGLYKIILSLTLVLLAFGIQAQEPLNDCCETKIKKIDKAGTAELGYEYQRLKAKDGGCCDRYGSNMMNIMQELEVRLSDEGTTIYQVLRIMGSPDATEKDDVASIISFNPNQQVLIYYWRGNHDFLYFLIENKEVIGAEWFFAYE